MTYRNWPWAGGGAIVLARFRAVGRTHRNLLGPCGSQTFKTIEGTAMHYPHRTSRIKRKRSIGFRARMKTTNGRKMMNRKRRAGRSLNVADK